LFTFSLTVCIPMKMVRSTVPSNAQQEDQVNGMPRGMSRLCRLLSREEKDDQYWFLKLLAKEKALKSLCHHPYITAFLDLHYSTVEKARSQMKDSVPHLALTLLFLVLVSTMPGHLQDNYLNVLWLAIVPCATVLLIDIISLRWIANKCINKGLDGSLVKDIGHRQESGFERIARYFVTFTHIFGYIISAAALAFGGLASAQRKLLNNALNNALNNGTNIGGGPKCEENQNDKTLKYTLEIMLLVYPMLLMGVEITQMKSAGLRNYIKSSKNRTDLVGIVFAFIIASVSMFFEDICRYGWIPNLIWIVILLSFTQLIYDIVDCLPNNDNFHAQHYLHMVTQVAKKYFALMMWFFPFLMAFAACFKAMANDDKEDEFAPNLFGAFVRTMVWFVGEVENEDMWISDKDGNGIHTKIEDWMAKFILLVFIFLFVVVVMNLMNAVAIVDIQELRNDVIGIRNRKKIKEIIEQNPEVSDKSYTSEIQQDPKPQSDNWFLGLFIDKGYFCESELDEHRRKNFLPEATFSALKECCMEQTWNKVTPRKLCENVVRSISQHSGPASPSVAIPGSSFAVIHETPTNTRSRNHSAPAFDNTRL